MHGMTAWLQEIATAEAGKHESIYAFWITTEPSRPASSKVDVSEAANGLAGTPDINEKVLGPSGVLLRM